MKKILLSLLLLTFFCRQKANAQSMNCATATQLNLNNGTVCVGGTNVGAVSNNILFGGCNMTPVNMVWYTYITNGSNNNFTVAPGTLQNAELVIYQGGCPGTGTLQNCVTAVGSNSIITNWGMTAGTQVWIGIASTSLNDGTFNLCINSQPPIVGAGNVCATAIPVCSTIFAQPNVPSNSSGQLPNCFASAPQQDLFLKFTIKQPGVLAWTAMPTLLTTEFDWCLWDITGGCPGVVACCNYNFAAGSSLGFGMQNIVGNVPCGYNLATGVPQREFSPTMNVVCGRIYMIQISNYSNNNTGFNLNFTNSTALIASNATFVVTPTLVCGSSMTVNINNVSTGACVGQQWTFGDATPTLVGYVPPPHTYTTPGTYAITGSIPGVCPSATTQFVQLLAPLAATVASSPINCFGQCTGTAGITGVTGGNGVYTYLWSNGATTSTIGALCAGIYSVTITNTVCGTSITRTVNITAPPQLSITATSFSATCGTANGSITVNGSGGTPTYSYSINGGTYSTVTTFTGLVAGTYTMTVIDTKGCTTTTVMTVTQPPPPVITVNSATVCPNIPAILTASGGTTYSWTPAGGLNTTSGASVIATVSTTTNYTVSGTVAGCTGTAVASVVINPLPVPIANVNSPVCIGQAINFTGAGGVTYTWSGPGAFSSNVQNPIIASAQASNAGVYTLNVSNAFGCTKNTTVNLVVNPLPVIVVNNPTVCVAQNISLTATGGTAYAWSGPLGYNSILQNPVIANAQTNMSGGYTVTVTSAFGCTNTAVAQVSVIALPQPTIVTNSPVCIGATLSFTGSGGGTYSWNGPNGFASGFQNPNIPNVQLAANGVYSLVVTVGSCSNITTAPVIINPLPTPTALSNSPVCLLQPINFTGNGGTTYTWTGPGGFNNTTQNPIIAVAQNSNAGTYTLTVTNANGCVNFTTTNVVINPLPVIVVNNPTVCIAQNISLTATGGTAYAWSGPLGFNSILQNPVIANAQLTMNGGYTVIVTSAFGCTNTAVANVSVITLPNVNILSNSPVCVGGTLSFTASGAGAYNWSGPNGFASLIPNPSITNVSFAAGGIYTVVGTAGTCSNVNTTTVVINPLPTPTAISNSPVCQLQPINFTGSGGTTYTWTGAGLNSTIQNPTIAVAQMSNNATYTLTVTNANGCVNFTTTTVVVNPTPNIVVNNPTTCVGTNINLTSNGGVGFSWSGPLGYASLIQNPVIINAQLTMTGAYVVTVTSAFGCTNQATAQVSVIALPQPTALSNGPKCIGQSLQLQGQGGTSYNWSGPNGFISGAQNPIVPNVSLASAGIYSLVATANTCTNIATVSVVINPLPNPNIISNSPVCLLQPINFSGLGGVTYTWSGPGGYSSTSQNPTIAIAQNTNAGTYTLTVTDANNCSNSITAPLSVNPLPSVSANGASSCSNTPINLSAFGAVSYVWSGPSGFSSNVQNPVIAMASMSNAGQYTVIGTSAQGCTNSALCTVNVIPAPQASITANDVCIGANLILIGNGGTSYLWSGPNAFTSNFSAPNIPNAPLAATGIYTLIASIGTCSGTVTKSITVHPLPTPTLSNNSPVCMKDQIQLIGSGGNNYAWSGPSGWSGNGAVVTIPNSGLANVGTYTAIATDMYGCVNTATINVAILPLPIIGTRGSTLCATETITLDANGGVSYQWTGPQAFAGTGGTLHIPNSTTLMAGEYTVIAIGSNGCKGNGVATVSINPTPVITINGNSPVCANSTLQLTASAPAAVQYFWSGPNNFMTTQQNPKVIDVNQNAGGTYTVYVNDQWGCKSNAVVNMIVRPLPTVNIAADKLQGCVPICLNLAPTNSLELASLTWEFGDGNVGYGFNVNTCYNNPGTYNIKTICTDNYGCKNSAVIAAHAWPIPIADFNYSPSKPLTNEVIEFTDASREATVTQWNWFFSNTGNKLMSGQNINKIFEEEGAYAAVLIVTSDHGCKDTIVKEVVVGEDFGIYVPNAFTPNGDNINDTFQPKGYGITEYQMAVFDRWGEKLFQTDDFFKGWDGYFRGDLSKQDTYVWKIVVKNKEGKSKELKGIVTLVR